MWMWSIGRRRLWTRISRSSTWSYTITARRRQSGIFAWRRIAEIHFESRLPADVRILHLTLGTMIQCRQLYIILRRSRRSIVIARRITNRRQCRCVRQRYLQVKRGWIVRITHLGAVQELEYLRQTASGTTMEVIQWRSIQLLHLMNRRTILGQSAARQAKNVATTEEGKWYSSRLVPILIGTVNSVFVHSV